MSAKIVVKQAFGINPQIRNCVGFTEEHHLAYSCGHQLAVINTESKEQSFIAATSSYQHQSLGITCFAICASKKLIAVAEKVEPAAIVTFYDSHTLKKRRVLTYNEIGSNEIKCIAFSDDSRHMLVQGGGPEWNLVLWNIEKTAKVVCSIKISQSDEMPVHHVTFCPWDSTLILILGKSILRLFRFMEGQLKQATLTVRREISNFISFLWLPDECLLVGTDSGDIMFIENFEFRGYINTKPINSEDDEIYPVNCLLNYNRGFIMGTNNSEIKIFERTDDLKEKYILDDTIKIKENRGDLILFATGTDEALVCATSLQQLITIQLTNKNEIKNGISGIENILTSFHGPNLHGDASIIGIDVALWRHIIVTIGRDCTVRIWNIIDKKMELIKQFSEEPISLSVHPSGLYIAIGFNDRILILSILLDEIFIYKEIIARNCSIIKFSHGGHILASANGTNLQLYNTYTGNPIGTLRGHNNKIKSILWLQYDSKIITIGSEGIVYSWDLFPINRRNEQYTGSIPINSGIGPIDGSKIYIATQEKLIKELNFNINDNNKNLKNNTTTITNNNNDKTIIPNNTIDTLNYQISCMLYDENRKILILGTANDDLPGALITINLNNGGLPTNTTTNSNTNLDINIIHSSNITSICQSRDQNLIITGDSNGCICISEYENNNLIIKNTIKDSLISFEFIDEVLIHKSDLENRKNQINVLTLKVDELNNNNEHQLRLKDIEHIDNKNEIEEKYNLMLNMEKIKFNELNLEKSSIEIAFNEKLKLLEKSQLDELKTIEFKYKTKQNNEENRLKLLQDEVNESHIRWNNENIALINSHQKYLQELTIEYEEKLLNEQNKQKILSREKDSLKVHFDSNQTDTEKDGDHEIAEMKIRYDAKLKLEDETSLQLMHLHAIMTKTQDNLIKECNIQKIEIKRLHDKESRLYDTIHSLEKDIQSHKKEIKEREETITDKEKRIFELKKKNQELEKFRFVLDYKIKELKLQIAPRENEINTMKTQISEMDLELIQYNKSNLALNLMIEELKLKLDGVKKELTNQNERVIISERIMEKFKRDLQDLWAVRNDPTLFKANMIKMYRIYVQEDISPSTMGSSNNNSNKNSTTTTIDDPQIAYNRDREQLERSLDSLRRSLKTESIAHKRDSAKMMRESVMLVKELNSLRKTSRIMQLQKKAIDETGELNSNTNLNELMVLLGVHIKKQISSTTNTTSSNSNTNKEDNRNLPPHPPTTNTTADQNRLRNANNMTISRTVALKTTNADGKVNPTNPVKRSHSAGNNNNTTGTTTGATGVISKQDQWEAWREIQMQYDTMKGLEEHLIAVCHSINIDPIPLIVSIDSNLL